MMGRVFVALNVCGPLKPQLACRSGDERIVHFAKRDDMNAVLVLWFLAIAKQYESVPLPISVAA